MTVLWSPQPDLSGEALKAALSSSGWVAIGGQADRYERWALPDHADATKLLVPLDPARPDYRELLADAWSALETLAVRAPEARAVVLALTRAPGDEIRFRKEAVTIRGAVSWPDGEDLVVSARNALVAAAKSRLSRRSYYGNRHGRFARRFLEGVLMGQTQVGSYVVTAYAPVDELFPERTPPASASGISTVAAAQTLGGYRGREITEALGQGLAAVQEATAHYASAGSMSGFDAGVERGVSREMTDAVYGMLRHSVNATVEIEWSVGGQQRLDLVDAAPPVRSSFTFEASALPVLERASRRLASLASSEFVTITGWVSVVSRPSRRAAGVIRLRVVRGSVARTVSVRLSDEQFQTAGAEVTDEALVTVSGRLEREGSRYWLYDPREITVTQQATVVAPGLQARLDEAD